MQEIETKVLEVSVEEIKQKLKLLGAKETQNTRLIVDWYCPKETKQDKHPWYLRIRTTSGGKNEISWKSLPKITGNTRHSDEINMNVGDAVLARKLFEAIGLENYAHQEKDRISFVLKDWNFDLDQYPGMPAYLEIEGKSHEHVQEAIKLLNLENHRSIGEGEKILIEKEYKLNWSDMRF
ncbi:MAG: CYTH domain-containing protein [bacterium]|nr:CYTH domain-containing protein [bacterium]